MRDRPNFLFIITDQQRHDSLGCTGGQVVRTPHIDRLAARGTNFSRFHVATPVCMPNRASLMTGRYPSVHGLRCNGNHLPANAVTFVDVLAHAGYHTAGIGKAHLQPFTDAPPEVTAPAGALGPLAEARFDDGHDYRAEHPANYAATTDFAFPTPYYGFQHMDVVTNHGQRCKGHYLQWLRRQDPQWPAYLDPTVQLPHGYTCPQARRTTMPAELYPTSYIKERAQAYLRGRQGQAAPFFAFVSFPDPHHPFNPPGKYWDMYDPADFDPGPPYERLVEPIPPLRHLRADYEAGRLPPTEESAWMATPRQVQEARALTAGMVTMIDDAVGELLATLQEAGLADDTVVVFTSDHGDYLGDYGLLYKAALPYRSITQVPCIWADPAHGGGATCAALCSTLDIAPTIIARAGLKPYWGIQGHDLGPVLAGGPPVRDELMVEFHDSLARLGFAKPPTVRALLTGRYRYTAYMDEDYGELYDLLDDPAETVNLHGQPGHAATRALLAERLVQHMMRAVDTSPLPRQRA